MVRVCSITVDLYFHRAVLILYEISACEGKEIARLLFLSRKLDVRVLIIYVRGKFLFLFVVVIVLILK